MKLGLIARADNSGLGAQSWEFHRHMEPERTMVIDVGHLADDDKHCNKRTFRDRYPDARWVRGWCPALSALSSFLHGLDVVFVAETPYNYSLFTLAEQQGIRTVLQYNWEFLDHLKRPALPRPTLFAAPSTWHYNDVPFANKALLPVPIATDRFTAVSHGPVATEFLHIVGRPAAHDRNGTIALLSALQHISATVRVTITCQHRGYVEALIKEHRIRMPNHVDLNITHGDVDDYWQLYAGDVLIMPRRFGGLCLPAQEAIGAGMPVIMPAIAPNIDWLPADWLIPATMTGSFNARSSIDLYSTSDLDLAAKIDQFATDAAFYADARMKAAHIATELSWATMAPRYRSVLAGT